MVDRYTKIILTIIAVALVWLAGQQTLSSAKASSGAPQPVFIAQISSGAAKCIGAYTSLFKGDNGSCIAMW